MGGVEDLIGMLSDRINIDIYLSLFHVPSSCTHCNIGDSKM